MPHILVFDATVSTFSWKGFLYFRIYDCQLRNPEAHTQSATQLSTPTIEVLDSDSFQHNHSRSSPCLRSKPLPRRQQALGHVQITLDKHYVFRKYLRVLELAPNPPLWLQLLLPPPPSSPSILQSKYTWVHSSPLFASYSSNGPGNIQPIDIKSEWLSIKINDRTLLL